MKNMILAVMLAAAPAAAQTTLRVPGTVINTIPGLGASFDGARFGSSPMLMPGSPAGITALVLSAAFDPARLGAPPLLPNVAAFNPQAPTPGIPAELLRPFVAAAAPAADSPLNVIRDASANEAQKTAALNQLFENSAPSSPETLSVSAQSAAAIGPKSSNKAASVPEWFSSSGLSFTLMKKSADGLLMAVLRHGRYELGLFLDKNTDNQAIFTKYSLNPMGTPLKEEVSLRTEATRRAVAKILRDAQAKNPVHGQELAALEEILTYLDGAGRAGARLLMAAPASYTWHDRPIENGRIFSGESLPTVSVVNTKNGIEATIDGKPVTIGFIGAPDGPPTAMVFKQDGEAITVDLDGDFPSISGTLSGETISAIFNESGLIISHGAGRSQMTMNGALRLTGLQDGDVPQPVRRFAAYMLILRSVIGSWR